MHPDRGWPCFFCLGVSSAGMTEEAYSRVTYDVTMAAATIRVRLEAGRYLRHGRVGLVVFTEPKEEGPRTGSPTPAATCVHGATSAVVSVRGGWAPLPA